MVAETGEVIGLKKQVYNNLAEDITTALNKELKLSVVSKDLLYRIVTKALNETFNFIINEEYIQKFALGRGIFLSKSQCVKILQDLKSKNLSIESFYTSIISDYILNNNEVNISSPRWTMEDIIFILNNYYRINDITEGELKKIERTLKIQLEDKKELDQTDINNLITSNID
jgi:hypothetical protein